MIRNEHCKLCPLHEGVRHACVCGEGDPHAKIMAIGEAPGQMEDCIGRPFVGPAGSLWNFVLGKLGLRREDIFLTNCLRCRPPNNELPGKRDVEAHFEKCRRYLDKEMDLVEPKVILLLGQTALGLITAHSPITKWEGMEAGEYEGVPCIAAFHPAYVLRSPSKEIRLAQAVALACRKAGVKVNPKGWEAGKHEYEVRL